jgi:solute carrier family 25 thiamine pyrophosphate transporter 19
MVAELMWVAAASIQFGSFAMYKIAAAKVLGTKVRPCFSLLIFLKEIPTYFSLFCGAAAGATATSLTYPLDLLRTRFAAQGLPPVYNSIGHAVTTIYRTNGIKGFYYGICPSLWQFVPYVRLRQSTFFNSYQVGIQFFVYDGLQKFLRRRVC